jgi:hypothetical protein
LRHFILDLPFSMIDSPAPGGERKKADASKDKSPSHPDGLRVAIEQSAPNNPEQGGAREAQIASERVREPSRTELLPTFILGCALGFGFATILWALVWHIKFPRSKTLPGKLDF